MCTRFSIASINAPLLSGGILARDVPRVGGGVGDCYCWGRGSARAWLAPGVGGIGQGLRKHFFLKKEAKTLAWLSQGARIAGLGAARESWSRVDFAASATQGWCGGTVYPRGRVFRRFWSGPLHVMAAGGGGFVKPLIKLLPFWNLWIESAWCSPCICMAGGVATWRTGGRVWR